MAPEVLGFLKGSKSTCINYISKIIVFYNINKIYFAYEKLILILQLKAHNI